MRLVEYRGIIDTRGRVIRRTYTVGINTVSILFSSLGFRFMPDRVNRDIPKHKSGRVSQAKGAGLVRSPAGRWRCSIGKAAILSALSRLPGVYRDQENNILLALSLTVASLSIGLSISLTVGYLR